MAVVRITFGVAVVVNTVLYLPVLVQEYYVDTSFHFTYEPFSFLGPLPGFGMHLVYVAMGATGVVIALGCQTRVAAAGLLVLNTYVFLLDSSFFQNHEYLISLLALLLVVVPTDRRWSLDAWHRGVETRPPKVPRGVVWLLRFQIGVPYVYGGLAKVNLDWLRGEPLRSWLQGRTDIEPIRSLLTNETVVWTMTYGALVFDLVIVALLSWRRTRQPAFVAATGFHLANAWLFGLFIFPWLMIAATTIFFPPEWPTRLLARRWSGAAEGARVVGSGDLGRSATPPEPVGVGSVARGRWRTRLVAVGIAAWVGTQLVVPLRHHLVAGDPSWTEQAHRFSWHMRRRAKSGSSTFLVDDGQRTVVVHPVDHLGPKQSARLVGHPERLVQFARHLSELHDGAVVRAQTIVSLNGRPSQPIVDPEVDLSSVRYRPHGTNDWVLPLEEDPTSG
ncbi:HTTM domain-containing protein [soil metagenome]